MLHRHGGPLRGRRLNLHITLSVQSHTLTRDYRQSGLTFSKSSYAAVVVSTEIVTGDYAVELIVGVHGFIGAESLWGRGQCSLERLSLRVPRLAGFTDWQRVLRGGSGCSSAVKLSLAG